MKSRYTITEAANALGLRTHTLRYWEEELELEIPRNEMGHRVYYEEQMEQFRLIGMLKDQGYQLTAIKMQLQEKFLLPIAEEKNLPEKKNSAHNAVKLEQFQLLMNEVVKHAMEENNAIICNRIEERILKEMNYLMREQEEQARERYLLLDRTIRQHMQGAKKEGLFSKRTNVDKQAFAGEKNLQNKGFASGKTMFGQKKEAVTKCSHATNTL